MGAATALLVIVTLLNAINGDLPQTSYMKFMDIWFMWHILNIFAMIIHHIIIDHSKWFLIVFQNYLWLPFIVIETQKVFINIPTTIVIVMIVRFLLPIIQVNNFSFFLCNYIPISLLIPFIECCLIIYLSTC